MRLAAREERTAEEEVIYLLKQVGGKRRRQGQVCSKCQGYRVGTA